MKTYVFAVKGMDITRKSITGPGNTLKAVQRGIVIPDNLGQDELLNALVAHASEYGVTIPSKFVWLTDEQGRIIIYARKLAVAALIPQEKWAGFLFCPKM
jgi:hypothetical protein